MNKKLMAVAVAGAFVTPALVFAQTATVQVYGKATAEYGYADQGSGKPNTDIFQTPGGSNVGFKGQEMLGGGLSAWFQCESSADVRGLNQDGFCTRNSAIGLRGGWGNLYFGKWDTPFKKAASVGTLGTGETGLLGAAFLFVGNSTGGGALGGQGASQSLGRNVWKRRETGTINYESPDFSGFKIGAAFSAANATAAVDATTNAKPRVLSIGGMYSNGPLNVGLGYERHNDFGSGFTGSGGDDRAWSIGVNYNFGGKILVGAQYVDMKYETGGGSDMKKHNWHLGADWNFAGPHHLYGVWVNAGDTKGNARLHRRLHQALRPATALLLPQGAVRAATSGQSSMVMTFPSAPGSSSATSGWKTTPTRDTALVGLQQHRRLQPARTRTLG